MISPMRFAHCFVVAIVFPLLVSCGDDPLTPGGTYVAPTYHASVQSLDATFRAICGAGANDSYAVGDLILHHDGSTWSPIEPPDDLEEGVRAAFGFPTGELLMISDDHQKIFLRKDGTWTRIKDAPAYAWNYWASAPDNIYGLSWPSVLHFDGTDWQELAVPKNLELEDIAGDENGRPLMCGHYGRIDRFDGAQFTTTYVDSVARYSSPIVTPSGRLFVTSNSDKVVEIVGSDAVELVDNGVYADYLRNDGEQLFVAGQEQNTSNYLVKQYEGDHWREISRGSDRSDRFRDFWAGRGELLGAGEGFVWQGNSSGGARVPLYPSLGPIQDAVAIDGAIYAIGLGAYRYEHGVWTDLEKEYITEQTGWCIDGRNPHNIYAAGAQVILHYDGDQWTWVNGALGERLRGIWVEPNGHVVAVGEGPVIVEFDGTQWTKTPVPSDAHTFTDVVGTGALVMAVGYDGLNAIRRNGEWHILPPPTNNDLVALWAYDESHIYAASSRANEICVWDGRRWDPMLTHGQRLFDMRGIWGTSPSNLFALGYNGTLAHFDGRKWTAQERILLTGMSELCGNGNELLAVGRTGILSYRR